MIKSLTTILSLFGIVQAVHLKGLGSYMGYLAKQGKSYENIDEFTARLANFNAIDTWIKQYNSDPEMTARMGHNRFSDLSDVERSNIVGKGLTHREEPKNSGHAFKADENAVLPQAWTWKGSNKLSTVFDSGNCSAAGFAFSAVTAA